MVRLDDICRDPGNSAKLHGRNDEHDISVAGHQQRSGSTTRNRQFQNQAQIIYCFAVRAQHELSSRYAILSWKINTGIQPSKQLFNLPPDSFAHAIQRLCFPLNFPNIVERIAQSVHRSLRKLQSFTLHFQALVLNRQPTIDSIAENLGQLSQLRNDDS